MKNVSTRARIQNGEPDTSRRVEEVSKKPSEGLIRYARMFETSKPRKNSARQSVDVLSHEGRRPDDVITTPNAEQNTLPPTDLSNDDIPPPVQDLTTRGTPRIRAPMRSRDQLGGDPNSEANRLNVKLSGRVPRELRSTFASTVIEQGTNQSAVLTELIKKYLEECKTAQPN